MIMKWNTILVTAVITACRGLDIGKFCPNLSRDLKTCVTHFPSVLSNSSELIFTESGHFNSSSLYVQDRLSIICQESILALVKTYFDCSSEKYFSCVPTEWQRTLPEIKNDSKRSVDLMCETRNDFDFGCRKNYSKALDTCGNQRGATQNNTDPDLSTVNGYLVYVCRLYGAFVSCAKSVYANCSGKTAAVSAEMIQLLVPTGCSNLSSSSEDQLSTASSDNLSTSPGDQLSTASNNNLSTSPGDQLSTASNNNLSTTPGDQLPTSHNNNFSGSCSIVTHAVLFVLFCLHI